MLRISFINVGYGDAILVEELRDKSRVFAMLIDGGAPYTGGYRDSYDLWPSRIPAFRYLSSRGIGTLDAIFLTHFHIDHVGGMPAVMQSCAFGQLWSNFSLTEPERLEALNVLAIDNGTAVEMRLSLNLLAEMQRIAGERGKSVERVGMERRAIALTDKLAAEFFEEDQALSARTGVLMAAAFAGDFREAQRALIQLDGIQNAAGVALRLSYAGRKIFLPADLPHTHWKSYGWTSGLLSADILKVAHHGQADSMTRELAAKIAPRHAVVSVSSDNPFGAPSPKIFDMFDADVEFWTTENIEVPPQLPGMPPRVSHTPPHRAVIFDISLDGEISVSLD